MTPESSSNILAVVEQYLCLTGIPHTTFGRRAVNDPGLVIGMRGGRELRYSTANRVIDHVNSRLEILTRMMEARLMPSAEAA